MLTILLSSYSFNISLLLGLGGITMCFLGLFLGIWINYLGSAIPAQMEALFWSDVARANKQLASNQNTIKEGVNNSQQTDNQAFDSKGVDNKTISPTTNIQTPDTAEVNDSHLGLELLQVLWSWKLLAKACKDYTSGLVGESNALKWRVYSLLVVSTLALPTLVAGFGFTAYAAIGIVFFYICLLLMVIDWETQLLPDFLVYILLWCGLAWQALGYGNTDVVIGLPNAIMGGLAGYAIVFIIGTVFFWLRGLPGIGLGDAKLLAALGVWCGWQLLPQILLIASLCGLLYALMRKLWVIYIRSQNSYKAASDSASAYIPNSVSFGPFLIIGAVLAAAGILEGFYG